MAGSEAFSLIIMGGAAYALIRFLAFILDNMADALDNGRDRFADAFGDMVALPGEARAAAGKAGGGAANGQRLSITHSHNNLPVSHSGSGASK